MNSNWHKNNFKKVLNGLDELIEKAEIQNYDLTIPDKKTRKEIREIIFDFVKKNKRIIFGGTAIDFWICKRDSKKSIYKNCPGDIEFYSPEPLQDTFELCNIFLKKGFKNILGRDAIHENTYKIFVEHTDFCDISLMSKAISKNNVPVEESNGILYVKPDFLLTDIFRVFSNPLHDYSFRLKKVYERFNKLRCFYYNPPIKPKECKITGIKNTLLDIKSFIYDNFIVNNKEVILCGTTAYSIYLKESDYLEKDKTAYNPKDDFELILISNEIKNTACDILKIMEKNFDSEKISIKEYSPFFQFYDRQISIFYKNKPVVTVYGYNEICTQYHKFEINESDFIQIVGFDYLMMWMNTMLFRTYPIKNKKEHYRCMIYYLFLMQLYYLKKNNLIGLEENHLFSHFVLNCKWKTLSIMYRKKEELKKKAAMKNRKGPLVFEYRPEIRMVEKFPNKLYINQSGNQILNRKNLLIKKEKYLPDNILSNKE